MPGKSKNVFTSKWIQNGGLMVLYHGRIHKKSPKKQNKSKGITAKTKIDAPSVGHEGFPLLKTILDS